MKDEKKKALLDYQISDLGYLRWGILLLPCVIWVLIVAVIDTFLVKMPLSIAKNIYDKLVDIFKR